MPISINVGLSKKSSVDYQSQGRSINLTAELDGALLSKPVELQRQIAALYQQAEIALDQAATDAAAPKAPPTRRANGKVKAAVNTPGNGTGHQSPVTASRFNADGHHNGHTNGNVTGGSNEPLLTASQHRAILSIAQRHKIDATTECLDEFGCPIEQLTIRQASGFIDGLLQLPGNGRVGVR